MTSTIMKKLILIDEMQIGNLFFAAYVVEDHQKLPAFAIYINSLADPIILFQQQIDTNIINITVEVSYCDYIQREKSKEKSLRQKYLQTFTKFVNTAEARAKKTIFKEKEMRYVKDDRLVKKIKSLYLNEIS